MNTLLRSTLLGLLAVTAIQAVAADNAPALVKPGKVLFEDDFSRTEMKPKWKVGKGYWTIADGVVTGIENLDDHHGAYAYIDPNIGYKDVVAEFSFKLDGAKSLTLNMRDSAYKGSHAGHVLRATVTPTQVQLVDMKMGGMKNEYYEKTSDPKATPAEKKAINDKIKDKSASFKITLDQPTWHQARVEVAGDEIIMLVDGKVAGYLKSEGIDHATKNMLGFTVNGKSAQIKNAKFCEGTPATDWSAHRDEVVAGLKK